MKRLLLIAALILSVTNLYSQDLNKNNSDLKLEIIGSVSASNLYLSYLTIGVIADSYTKKVYDNQRTVSFVKAAVVQAGLQKKTLEKLIQANEVSGSDLEAVKKMVDCYSLLADEGNYFIDYINTKSKDSLRNYDGKRKEAWALISQIMGIGK